MNELLRRSRGPHVSQRLPDRCGLGAAGASYAPDRWSPIPPTGLEREAKPSPSVTIRRSQRLPVIPRRISLVPQLPIVASRFTRDERLLWSFLSASPTQIRNPNTHRVQEFGGIRSLLLSILRSAAPVRAFCWNSTCIP
jgi:hypothetical protein